MGRRSANENASLGQLKWLLLVGVVAILFFQLLTWPFRAIRDRWPGRRERLLNEWIAETEASIPSATRLVEIVGGGAPDLRARFEKKIRALRTTQSQALANALRVDDVRHDDPWAFALDILEKARLVGGIDHRSAPDELRAALAPLLKKRQLSLDWSFLHDLERISDSESLKNETLLPIVGERIAALGYVMVHIDEGSDNYRFAICSPADFAELEALSSGGYAIRRFSRGVQLT